jgi:hypothetical protein
MGTIGGLGLPGRAVTALTRAGVTSIEQLAALTRDELTAIGGLGTGMISAIRRVVPEPHGGTPEEESPAAPAIPSFDSLRAPRRRSAVDLLVPERTSAPPAAPPVEPPPAPARPAAGPRPAEYADLLPLLRAAVILPARVALWSVREPVRLLRRLLGV